MLPWLEEGPTDGVWQSWQVTFRDVVVLDGENHKVAVYNLSLHDLADPAAYAELKGILLGQASSQ